MALMRVFCPIVEIPALPMNDMRPYTPLRGSIAAKLVGDKDARLTACSLQELTKKARGRHTVPLRLDPNIDHRSLLIDNAPQILLHSVDLQEDLVQKPLGSQLGPVSFLEFFCEVGPELAAPFADGFVGQLDALPSHRFFDISIAHWKPEV